MPRKTALITGITGQDGHYLASLLLRNDYHVIGVARRSSSAESTWRIDPLLRIAAPDRFRLVYGDLLDFGFIGRLLGDNLIDEIYNLAGQSDVGVSFEAPSYTFQVNAMGFANLLEAVRCVSGSMPPRIYQASTSEMFGDDGEVPQRETTRFRPASPYAASKLAAHNMARIYRDAYGMHISCGILFNHESPMRGPNFVTSKIARAAAHWSYTGGSGDPLRLGNVSARRDWGHASDYVYGMWQMLQQDQPDDYVLATGRSISVSEFAVMAFAAVNINLEWGIGRAFHDRRLVIRGRSAPLERPLDVGELQGDASKAREKLGWSPTITVEHLAKEMVEAELAKLRR